MSTLATVDALAGAPVLVFGTPPPAGRDLDLLARPSERRVLAEGLAGLGFSQDGRRWVRFASCSVEVVELVPAEAWGLPASELDALFGDSVALDGMRNLRRPAPQHELLILSRQAAWSGLDSEAKQRGRLAAVVAGAPAALERARVAAPAWGAGPALSTLEHALRSGRAPRLRERAAAIMALQRARGTSRFRAGLVAARAVARRPRRGRLVTLSGLDGAGKSSQAAALRETLDRLGYDAVVRWTSLSQHPPLLHLLTRTAARLLRRRTGASPTEGSQQQASTALRERSALLTAAWSTIVALVNAFSQARCTLPDLWRGRVVICDRYTLDSKVHLRYAYGEERAFRFQTTLIRLLSPRPDRSYLLDVSAEEATRRKADYPLAENSRRARLYREEYLRLGMRRIDGERTREQICADLAVDVWRMLGGTG